MPWEPKVMRTVRFRNAREITYEMLAAAAQTIADKATGADLVPNPLDKEVH